MSLTISSTSVGRRSAFGARPLPSFDQGPVANKSTGYSSTVVPPLPVSTVPPTRTAFGAPPQQGFSFGALFSPRTPAPNNGLNHAEMNELGKKCTTEWLDDANKVKESVGPVKKEPIFAEHIDQVVPAAASFKEVEKRAPDDLAKKSNNGIEKLAEEVLPPGPDVGVIVDRQEQPQVTPAPPPSVVQTPPQEQQLAETNLSKETYAALSVFFAQLATAFNGLQKHFVEMSA